MTALFLPYTSKLMSEKGGETFNIGKIEYRGFFAVHYDENSDQEGLFKIYFLDYERYKIQVFVVTVAFAGLYLINKERSH